MRLTSQDGYDAKTQSAVADLKAGTVHGEHGIDAQGSMGHITADRFALNRETRQLKFDGNVRMIINKDGSFPLKGTQQ